MNEPKKSLGQHWLKDKAVLESIADAADIKSDDVVLEIGPGKGSLTAVLTTRARQVVAVEKDEALAGRLQGGNLRVIPGDILQFDFNQLPPDYKIVANIPYYLTSHLLRVITESSNLPIKIVLLVQKEVARRIMSEPGQMNLLAVSVQLFFEPILGQVVPARLFTPMPKVDSQTIVLDRRPEPLFKNLDTKIFFRIIRAGFAGKRKKLRGSLAAGLAISKEQADDLLKSAGIDGNLRAQNLSLQDWHKIYLAYNKHVL